MWLSTDGYSVVSHGVEAVPVVKSAYSELLGGGACTFPQDFVDGVAGPLSFQLPGISLFALTSVGLALYWLAVLIVR